MIRFLLFFSMLAFSLSTFASTSFVAGNYTMPEGSGNPMLVQTLDKGQTWFFQSFADHFKSGGVNFNTADCSTEICIAAGISHYLDPALFLQSTDGGAHWLLVDPDMDYRLSFYASSCHESLCAALGWSTAAGFFVVQTSNAGKTWQVVDMNDASLKYSLEDVFCRNNYCVAVGDGIIESYDGGLTWAKATTDQPNFDTFTKVECYDNGCLAVGYTGEDAMVGDPVIFQSTHHTSIWTKKKLPLTTSGKGTLSSVSCNSASCVAVGGPYGGNSIILQSDNGSEWKHKSVKGLHRGSISDVVCKEQFCLASGDFQKGPRRNDVVGTLISNKNGDWELIDLPGKVDNSDHLQTINCNSTLCFARGDSKLFQSVNGIDWELVDVQDQPEDFTYTAAATQ